MGSPSTSSMRLEPTVGWEKWGWSRTPHLRARLTPALVVQDLCMAIAGPTETRRYGGSIFISCLACLIAGCAATGSDELIEISASDSIVSTEKVADQIWQSRDPFGGGAFETHLFEDNRVSVVIQTAGYARHFIDSGVSEEDLAWAGGEDVSLVGRIEKSPGPDGVYYWALGHDGIDECFLYFRRITTSVDLGYEQSGANYGALVGAASCMPGVSDEQLREGVLSIVDSIQFR